MYSPRFEGVHLRFADVARGGLRWSDRREDFRTEILGLAKAQEVKNSVIVPSGAKGGFVCKRLPDPADREAYQGEVLACYRMFISAMLDVTDNLEAGQVVAARPASSGTTATTPTWSWPRTRARPPSPTPPTRSPPAAASGWATPSPPAARRATTTRRWPSPPAAPGSRSGSTSRPSGVNVDTDDFTVAGVGDMSGDVFGNGMLLSRHIRLVAAFDHRHVFVDPDPDPAASFAERQRLFDAAPVVVGRLRPGADLRRRRRLAAVGQVRPGRRRRPRRRSGWPTGSPRSSPDQLISAILAAPVDLLWNGGIGTYVKATAQSSADVGDRSNDGLRIDAAQLRAKVVGEGGNLGLTQEARIEYALAGGLVNTDFIDNSAGRGHLRPRGQHQDPARSARCATAR